MKFPQIITPRYGDVNGYAEFARALVGPWIAQAWVGIVDPNQKLVEEDPITGVITEVLMEPIYVGWARVKQLRTALTLKKAIDSTTTRTVQFQMEYPKDGNLPDIPPGYEVVVIDGGNDPDLTLYRYTVTGSIGSSEAWNRTVETIVNLESRPNYDTSGWPQRPEA